ncbi:MAG: apolipoprotein N-acyltransferase [Candidatus Omnitrophota bacterium]
MSIIRDLSLSLLSGGLLSLAFLDGRFWFCPWFGFLPLFFVIKAKGAGKAFAFSYVAGLAFWVATIYWLIHITLPGLIVLVLYLALYFAIFGWAFSFFASRRSTARFRLLSPVAIAMVWACLEYLRGYLLTGFPWALLGYSQYRVLPIIQVADITGPWGVSFLIVLVNAAIYKAISERQKRHCFPLALFLSLSLIYGFYKLRRPPAACRLPPVRVSLIQPNIVQEIKWDPAARPRIWHRYLGLTKEALSHDPDLIVWPETAISDYAVYDAGGYADIGGLRDLTEAIDRPLFMGLVVIDQGRFYNSALLFSAAGDVLGRYDKLHLVPFGEYIPLRKRLPFLEAVVPIGDFSPGKGYHVFSLPGRQEARFSALICFEDIFPGIARRFVQNRASFLLNITNDAWFKDTAEPYQHLAGSVFRAVENRVAVLRAANTGISCLISPQGRIASRVHNRRGKATFVSGQVTAYVPWGPCDAPSIYTKYGDLFPLFALIFTVAYAIIEAKPR